jgi:hypothetical protein
MPCQQPTLTWLKSRSISLLLVGAQVVDSKKSAAGKSVAAKDANTDMKSANVWKGSSVNLKVGATVMVMVMMTVDDTRERSVRNMRENASIAKERNARDTKERDTKERNASDANVSTVEIVVTSLHAC